MITPRRNLHLSIWAGIVLVGVACGSKPASLTEDPSQLARLLGNPIERDRAACQLLKLQRYRSEPRYTEEVCKTVKGEVNHVILAPQPDRSPIYIVFRNPGYASEVAGPGKPKGPFTLFDSEGYILPVFGAANFLEEEDDVFGYAGDDRLAIAHAIRYGGGEDSAKWTAQALHIVPVLPAQRSVLTVVVGPPILSSDTVCAGFYWSWRHRDLDDDGVPEIEIGPRQNDAGDIRPRAVYRWSRKEQRYEGPSGSVESGFVRVDSTALHGTRCPYGSAIERFVSERRKLVTPGDPSAVRKNDCGRGMNIIEY